MWVKQQRLAGVEDGIQQYTTSILPRTSSLVDKVKHGCLFCSHKNFLSELPDNFETQVTNILVLSTKFLIRQQQNAELSPYFLFLLGVNFGRETFL